MSEIDKITIKIANMLDLDVHKIEKLFDETTLDDLASLVSAANHDSLDTIKTIYDKYSSKLNDLPNAKTIKAYFDNMTSSKVADPLADTADHFGLKQEEVEKLLGNKEETFIPDEEVKEAYDNIQEMIAGGKSKRKICELNTWQRRMLYGLVPDVVSKVMQKTLDATPISIMQKHAKLNGYGESAIHESEISLHEMIENIIELELNHFKGLDKKEEKYCCPYCLKMLKGKDAACCGSKGHAILVKEDADDSADDDDVDTEQLDESYKDCTHCNGYGHIKNKKCTHCDGCGTEKKNADELKKMHKKDIKESIKVGVKNLINEIINKKF